MVGRARPVRLIIARKLPGSFAWRDTRISRSSERLISPGSNIQCTVPDSASPLVKISGSFASTDLSRGYWATFVAGRCAAYERKLSTSAQSFRLSPPVSEQERFEGDRQTRAETSDRPFRLDR